MTSPSRTHPDTRQRRGLITGAGSGLGRAFANELAREGWELVLCDIDVADCEQTAGQVRLWAARHGSRPWTSRRRINGRPWSTG